jgi:hypothetical protein
MNAETSSLRRFQAGSESQPQPKDGGARHRTLFGQPQLLEGEDAAAYDELLTRICAAVKPADVIDEMLTDDVVSLEWEVLRWRRLKLSMIRKCAIENLEGFLRKQLHYDLYRDYFVRDLVEILEENLPQEQAKFAQTLAQQCSRNEKDAVGTVNKILNRAGLKMDQVVEGARDHKVKALVKEYAQREPDAVTLIDELLSSAGKSIDIVMAEALAWALDDVERVDRLATIAEGRRNASLREIDRRRPILAETLRQSVRQIESDELKVIEMAPARTEGVP